MGFFLQLIPRLGMLLRFVGGATVLSWSAKVLKRDVDDELRTGVGVLFGMVFGWVVFRYVWYRAQGPGGNTLMRRQSGPSLWSKKFLGK